MVDDHIPGRDEGVGVTLLLDDRENAGLRRHHIDGARRTSGLDFGLAHRPDLKRLRRRRIDPLDHRPGDSESRTDLNLDKGLRIGAFRDLGADPEVVVALGPQHRRSLISGHVRPLPGVETVPGRSVDRSDGGFDAAPEISREVTADLRPQPRLRMSERPRKEDRTGKARQEQSPSRQGPPPLVGLRYPAVAEDVTHRHGVDSAHWPCRRP